MAIQFKRQGGGQTSSASPAAPSSLNYGELAVASNGDLYVGNGSRKAVGVLTTNGNKTISGTMKFSGNTTFVGSIQANGAIKGTTTASSYTVTLPAAISSSANDTQSNWIKYNNGSWFYSDTTSLIDKPESWGFVQSYKYGSDLHQTFMGQPDGYMYHRGANGGGWGSSWHKLIDDRGGSITGSLTIKNMQTHYPLDLYSNDPEVSIRFYPENGILRYVMGTSTGVQDTTRFGLWYDPSGMNVWWVSSSGDFHPAGRSYNAVYNDYAEYFPRGEETEPGDLIALDLSSKEELYVRARKGLPVVGVHSNEYGHIIGGERDSKEDNLSFEEYNLKHFIPVGLCGRCRVKTVGRISKGQKIILSDIPGVGRAYNESIDSIQDYTDSIGIAVEDQPIDDNEIRMVRVKLK